MKTLKSLSITMGKYSNKSYDSKIYIILNVTK